MSKINKDNSYIFGFNNKEGDAVVHSGREKNM